MPETLLGYSARIHLVFIYTAPTQGALIPSYLYSADSRSAQSVLLAHRENAKYKIRFLIVTCSKIAVTNFIEYLMILNFSPIIPLKGIISVLLR